MHFVEKSKNFNKNEMGSKMENHTVFREMDLVLQLIQESQIKSKPVMSWSLGKKKREDLFYHLFCPKEIFLTLLFYLNV